MRPDESRSVDGREVIAFDVLARDLPEAVAERHLEINYQPQIDISTGRVVAVEGLSRWTHPEFGPIPPSEFIAVAEATGDIHKLGRLALERCCSFAKSWADRGKPLQVAVNVSPLQLVESDFFDELEHVLAETGAQASALILEVTESEKIADTERLAKRLEPIQQSGITVSIDDFGSGHSTAERATALHAGELKLDRGVIVGEDHEAAELASRVARANGMRIVAEGIETASQLRFAADIHCDRAQGYLIARPASAEEFDTWMRSRNHDD
jgi:EAL domain-containing protein (putative c-di-GMP-specific phosphodiesterase class I)